MSIKDHLPSWLSWQGFKKKEKEKNQQHLETQVFTSLPLEKKINLPNLQCCLEGDDSLLRLLTHRNYTINKLNKTNKSRSDKSGILAFPSPLEPQTFLRVADIIPPAHLIACWTRVGCILLSGCLMRWRADQLRERGETNRTQAHPGFTNNTQQIDTDSKICLLKRAKKREGKNSRD